MNLVERPEVRMGIVTSMTIERGVGTLNKDAIDRTTAYFVSHGLLYGHNCIYGKRGKHRKGTYVPATLNGRFSAKAVKRMITNLDVLMGRLQYNKSDLIQCLKRSKYK